MPPTTRKTAVSIPAPLFKKAEREARKLKISRSALYARALEAFLRRLRDEEIIERINRVCAEVDTSVDPVWKEAQASAMERTAGREDW